MKYVKINFDSIKIKCDPEDEEQLRHDVYEKVQAMIEAEVFPFSIDDEDEDSDELD
jgi:hypothetical protein